MSSLTSVFFSADLKSVLHFTVEYFNQAKYSMDNKVSDVLNYLIENYFAAFKNETADGHCTELHTGTLMTVIEHAIGFLEIIKFFKSPHYYGMYDVTNKHSKYSTHTYKPSKSKNDDNVFAVGHLTEDYKTNDSDCYETAGGYRVFNSHKNTPIYFYLNGDNTIGIKFDGDCVIDHYNNNFFGNSTGNGTTKYGEGERIEVRVINTSSHNVIKVLDKYPMFKIFAMDCEKGLKLAQNNLKRLTE